MARLLLLLCLSAISKGSEINSLKLEQVLILGRHNIRTPLTSNLEAYSAKTWPKFNESVADLTKKGALLESYMAEYIAKCLARDGFIEGCPKKDEILIYSNTKARTRDTAKAFAKAAFGSCNITVYHDKDITKFDPIFHPVIHNNSEYFKQQVINEMKEKINQVDLKESYLELNKILDLENSSVCKKRSICDLSEIKTNVVYKEGEEPNVSGSLFIGNNIVDTFIMSYYEGFPLENVAWGKITTEDQWNLITKIIKQNQDVRFNLTSGSKDFARPLLKYMFDIFKSGKPKLTVLIGHDSNLNSVINALGFNEYKLEKQFEPYPIGGKLMFQKWSDGENSYLKVEYVYQTSLQLRNADKSSLSQPPKKVLMELKDCKVDDYGFCPWSDFIKLHF